MSHSVTEVGGQPPWNRLSEGESGEAVLRWTGGGITIRVLSLWRPAKEEIVGPHWQRLIADNSLCGYAEPRLCQITVARMLMMLLSSDYPKTAARPKRLKLLGSNEVAGFSGFYCVFWLFRTRERRSGCCGYPLGVQDRERHADWEGHRETQWLLRLPFGCSGPEKDILTFCGYPWDVQGYRKTSWLVLGVRMLYP